MKSILAAFLLTISFFYLSAQKISETFSPIIKQVAYGVQIVQSPDQNYFVYGGIIYFNNSASGALVKIDQFGNPINTFKKVSTDKWIQNVRLLHDGKILIQGPFKYINGQRVGNIVLLNSDGSLDPAFQVDHNLRITSFAVQSTGKIVIAIKESPLSLEKLLRLNSDGNQDFSFSTNYEGNILKLLIGELDNIYVANLGMVFRLSPNGPIDNSYSFPLGSSRNIGVLVQDVSGKLIAATAVYNSSIGQFTYQLERFNTNGSLDNTFYSGTAVMQIGSLVIRNNGHIAIAGYFTTFDSQRGNVIDLNPDGTFNRVLMRSTSNAIFSIYEDGQDHIFITGAFTKINDSIDAKITVKLKPDDTVDPTFKILPATTVDASVSLAIQGDGKMLVGGGSNFLGSDADSSMLVRYLPDGRSDTSFHPAVNKQIGSASPPYIAALHTQDDNKIVVGGSNVFAGSSTAFGRLLATGEFDESFQIGTGPTVSNSLLPRVSIIRSKNSSLYVAGYFDKFDGATCNSFAILDKQGKKIGPEHNVLPVGSYIQDMEIQSDGKIVFMGTFPFSSGDNRRFVRLNTDGSVDQTFQLLNFNGNINDMEVDNDDNILICGSYLNHESDKFLVRFSAEGQEDLAFEGNGFKRDDFIHLFFLKNIKDVTLATGVQFTC
jgi:uncharacterized delta-60 repeat protein